MESYLRGFAKLLALPILLLPIALSSCSNNETETKDELAVKPATEEDIFLYRGIGASFLCNARSAGIEFPVAAGVSASTYAQVLNGMHDGYVESAGEEQLTYQQLYTGAEFQIVTAALQYCPDQVPEDVKQQVEDALSNVEE